MRKNKIKKAAVIALAGLMMTQAALTGCGKKNVDYNVDGTTDENGEGNKSDKGGISGKLGIPDSINETFDAGTSGLGSITVNCAEPVIPEVDKMVVAKYTPMSMTNEDKKKIAETLFEKDKGIYLYDYDHPTKEDIQMQIDWHKSQIELAKANGETDYLSYLEEEITNLENQFAEAPETYPDAGDYSGETFRGTVDGVKYGLSMYSNSNDYSVGMGSSVYFSADNALNLRPYEGAENGYLDTYVDPYSTTDETDVVNGSSMTQEEAKDIAERFLDSIGVTNVIEAKSNDLFWVYYNQNGEELAREADGYYFEYYRSIEGIPAYPGNLWSIDNLNQINGWINFPKESYRLAVYDGRVVEASWDQVFGESESMEDVELLPYDKIIESANTEISKYYEKYPPKYKNIEFNDVRLTYFLVSDGDGKCKYIPVWIFAQYLEYMDMDNSNDPVQLVVINAVDGSVIDIVEEAKKLGCFEDYSDSIIKE